MLSRFFRESSQISNEANDSTNSFSSTFDSPELNDTNIPLLADLPKAVTDKIIAIGLVSPLCPKCPAGSNSYLHFIAF